MDNISYPAPYANSGNLSTDDRQAMLKEIQRLTLQKSAIKPGVVDNLREVVDYGDIVIRRVSNGFVVRRIPPYPGGTIDTWVVEGNDIKDVGEQLTAIQATETIARSASHANAGTIQGALGSSLVLSKQNPDDFGVSGANKP